MHEVVTIETTGLGDRSYLIHDGNTAVVVDPQRDLDRVLLAAQASAVRIALVLETHIHNDYVTGGLALAEATGADYIVAATEDVGFHRTAARNGDQFTFGSLALTAVSTPGHTPAHLSYVLHDSTSHPVAVFTGGSMLFGAVGRTDLISADQTEWLTRAQYRSVRRLAEELPDDVAVYPTHGFGSFCSATPTRDCILRVRKPTGTKAATWISGMRNSASAAGSESVTGPMKGGPRCQPASTCPGAPRHSCSTARKSPPTRCSQAIKAGRSGSLGS